MKSRVTLKTIAERAGVNVSTVSRALNTGDRVNSETAAKIRQIAETLNYHPNELARSLVMNKSFTVGIVLPEVSNAFFAEVLMAIEKELVECGYSIILGLSHHQEEAARRCQEMLAAKHVDGLIAFSTELSDAVSHLPAVLVDCNDSLQNVDLVAADNAYGVQLALEHLISFGHKRIAYVTDSVTTMARQHAFLSITSRRGLHCEEYIVKTKNLYEAGGYESIEPLFEKELAPTAILCANDYMAIGCIKALFDRGISVPQDVSVIGFDDSTLLDYLPHSITTIRQPKQIIGQRAARLLVQRMNEYEVGNKTPRERVIITPELILRDSTSICKDGENL